MKIPSTEPASEGHAAAASPVGAESAAVARAAQSSAGEPAGRAGASSTVKRLALHFSLVLLAACVLGAWISGARGGLSAALGVALAGANLLLMRRITSALANASGASAAWALALPFKLVALVGIAYALVHLRVAQPVPLALGFALLPLTGVFLPRATSVPDLVRPASASRASTRARSSRRAAVSP